MGCRCNERRTAIKQAAQQLARGNLRVAGQQAGFVARTLVQDARSGALRQAAQQRLATLRK
jgi:hypothetical protein